MVVINLQVFDVQLNNEHVVIRNLDIFSKVGKSMAHDEYVSFTINDGMLEVQGEKSPFHGTLSIEFLKVCVFLFVCVCERTRMCVCVCVSVCACIFMYVCMLGICICGRMYMCVPACVCMCVMYCIVYVQLCMYILCAFQGKNLDPFFWLTYHPGVRMPCQE